MAYTDSPSTTKRTSAVSGVVIIHAAIGVVLVTGLTTNFVPTDDPPPFTGEQIPVAPPPPLPDEIVEPDPANPPTNKEIYTPPQPRDLTTSGPQLDTTRILPPPSPPSTQVIPNPGPTFAPSPSPAPPVPEPSPTLSLTPTPPAARGAQADWITTADYRSAWIRRGYEGTAGFRVTVGPNGRVNDCTITRPTGHSALDTATCKLVSRRARFEAARNSKGEKTTGTFTSSVIWQIPE